MPTLSCIGRLAVKTWVPSGSSGRAIVTGTSNTGAKPLRTNNLPSLRLTNNEIGPGRCCKGSSTFGAGAGSAADGSAGRPASAGLSGAAPPSTCGDATAPTSDEDGVVSSRDAAAPAPPATPPVVATTTAPVATSDRLGAAELRPFDVPGSNAASDDLTSPARRGCVISNAAASPRVMMTRAPTLVMPHRRTANRSGRRMQPWEAGWPGTTPACRATPDQVIRCMYGIGALL